MSKKISGVFALMGLCALSLFLLSCGSSSSRPSGVLYVLTQGSNGVGNNVSSYAIDLGSGNLSLINSSASTCNTLTANPPVACGPPLNIVLDPTGATAFVLNQGVPSASVAPTIYAYTIGSDGSFGSPAVAATLAVGDTAIAMTRDADGKFLFVITLAPQVLVFSTSPGSTTLTPVDNSALSVTRVPTALSAITFTPPGSTTSQELLFVTSNHDLVLHDDNTLSVYSVSSSGVLTEQPNSPYATTTDPISVLAVNNNLVGTTGGVFVYVGAQPTASGAMNIFTLCTVVGNNGCSASDVANALLKPVSGTAPSPGSLPVAMLVDPTNTFLYVVCEGSSQVFGYKISSTGTLSNLSPANQPTGSQPVAMAMHASVKSSGAFLYTSNSGTSNISGFSVSTTTGSMGTPFTVSSPSIPSGMAAK